MQPSQGQSPYQTGENNSSTERGAFIMLKRVSHSQTFLHSAEGWSHFNQYHSAMGGKTIAARVPLQYSGVGGSGGEGFCTFAHFLYKTKGNNWWLVYRLG